MSKPVLTYFNGRGRAELSRLILADAKVDYVDSRIDDHAALKAEGKLAYGQLPLYEEGNWRIVQSITIARYLARKHGYYGKTDKEGAEADLIIDGVIDMNAARFAAKTDEEKAKVEKEVIPKWLDAFTAILQKNHEGKQWFVGDNITFADLSVFNALGNLVNTFPHALDHHQLLTAHSERVAARPNIAAWLSSRPKSAW